MKYIYKVERCPLSALVSTPIPLPDGRSVWWEYFSEMEEIPIVGLAALSVKEDIEGGVKFIKTHLSATLRCSMSHFDEPAIYRITDTDARTYLIGTNIPPYPVSTTETTIDALPSSSAITRLLLEWTDIYPPLQLI